MDVPCAGGRTKIFLTITCPGPVQKPNAARGPGIKNAKKTGNMPGIPHQKFQLNRDALIFFSSGALFEIFVYITYLFASVVRQRLKKYKEFPFAYEK